VTLLIESGQVKGKNSPGLICVKLTS